MIEELNKLTFSIVMMLIAILLFMALSYQYDQIKEKAYYKGYSAGMDKAKELQVVK